jgi:hypothetical protein
MTTTTTNGTPIARYTVIRYNTSDKSGYGYNYAVESVKNGQVIRHFMQGGYCGSDNAETAKQQAYELCKKLNAENPYNASELAEAVASYQKNKKEGENWREFRMEAKNKGFSNKNATNFANQKMGW